MQTFQHKLKSPLLKRSYKLTLDIINFIKVITNGTIEQIVSRQLMRSGSSIAANLFEAQNGSSDRDFKKFFEIALKSSTESLFWMNIIKDSSLVENTIPLDLLINETTQISNMIAKSVITLKRKNKKY